MICINSRCIIQFFFIIAFFVPVIIYFNSCKLICLFPCHWKIRVLTSSMRELFNFVYFNGDYEYKKQTKRKRSAVQKHDCRATSQLHPCHPNFTSAWLDTGYWTLEESLSFAAGVEMDLLALSTFPRLLPLDSFATLRSFLICSRSSAAGPKCS